MGRGLRNLWGIWQGCWYQKRSPLLKGSQQQQGCSPPPRHTFSAQPPTMVRLRSVSACLPCYFSHRSASSQVIFSCQVHAAAGSGCTKRGWGGSPPAGRLPTPHPPPLPGPAAPAFLNLQRYFSSGFLSSCRVAQPSLNIPPGPSHWESGAIPATRSNPALNLFHFYFSPS